ncbi:hypothetical protein [Nonomuraea diastatica]|uniref:hypothetical protein n=1 Tax=Nonomuraea diastatica TaxID=1848329 RepID=UPI0015F2D68B|nr:hypothetical protein [Nonomuraea diastatica]
MTTMTSGKARKARGPRQNNPVYPAAGRLGGGAAETRRLGPPAGRRDRHYGLAPHRLVARDSTEGIRRPLPA